MPIYCLNGTKSAHKRSKNIIHELVGSNNYYFNSSQNLSSASYHILANKSDHKSLTSSSLVMAIDRFRNSVKNMKDTVLIPTRLSDLANCYESCDDNNTSSSNSSSSELCLESVTILDRPCTLCCELLLPPIGWSPYQPSTYNELYMPSASPTTQSSYLCKNNLYERFKLLDVVDTILCSDAMLTLCQRQNFGLSHICSISGDNEEGVKSECDTQMEEVIDEHLINGQIACGIEAYGKKLCRFNSSRSNSLGNVRSFSTSPEMVTTTGAMGQPQLRMLDASSHSSATLLAGCSLVKMKEQLEYHLNSLKNILHLMSNSADYITQKYLEDIHCEHRFGEKKLKDCEQTDAGIRHYYTGNNSNLQ